MGLCGCSLAADADGGKVLELGKWPGLRSAVAAKDETAHAAMVLPDDEREDEAARLATAWPPFQNPSSHGTTYTLPAQRHLRKQRWLLLARAGADFAAGGRGLRPHPVTVSSLTQSGPCGEILPMVFLLDVVQTRLHIILREDLWQRKPPPFLCPCTTLPPTR